VLLSNRVEQKSASLPFDRLPGALGGLRIGHLTDLHIRKPRPRHDEVIDFLADDTPDLIAITGDVMHRPGHEQAALDWLKRLLDRVQPRFGIFGCFGNHDSGEFKQAVGELPMTWLIDEAVVHPDLPLVVGGIDCQYRKEQGGDALKMALSVPRSASDHFKLALAHLPRWLAPIASVGFDLVLGGHTHGGQVRLPGPRPLYNASRHWPLELTSGIIRMNRTTAVISRGLGESACEGLRICCRPMVGLLTLTEGPIESVASPTLIEAW